MLKFLTATVNLPSMQLAFLIMHRIHLSWFLCVLDWAELSTQPLKHENSTIFCWPIAQLDEDSYKLLIQIPIQLSGKILDLSLRFLILHGRPFTYVMNGKALEVRKASKNSVLAAC
jgi:hypothetical protein